MLHDFEGDDDVERMWSKAQFAPPGEVPDDIRRGTQIQCHHTPAARLGPPSHPAVSAPDVEDRCVLRNLTEEEVQFPASCVATQPASALDLPVARERPGLLYHETPSDPTPEATWWTRSSSSRGIVALHRGAHPA
jgi:hypothetical protein